VHEREIVNYSAKRRTKVDWTAQWRF